MIFILSIGPLTFDLFAFINSFSWFLFEVQFAVNNENAIQIEEFRKSENGVMFSTDVMSRGIDINDISWVVQFEIPKLSRFVYFSMRY